MHRPILAALAAMLIGATASGQEIHSRHCLYGCPGGGDFSNDLIVRRVYILRSNDLTKLADWAAYRVSRDTIGAVTPTTWRADPVLRQNETLEPEDYRGAGVLMQADAGYQVPPASFGKAAGWQDTTLFSNIVPRSRGLNRGPWRQLEAAVRRLALSPSVTAVYVMTGPVFEHALWGLPYADEPHVVPSGFWKIVSLKAGDGARVAAFMFDQSTSADADYCNHQVSVEDISKKITLSFFHNLRGSVSPLAAALGC